MLSSTAVETYQQQWRRFRMLRNVWLITVFSALPLLWLTIFVNRRWPLGLYWLIWFSTCLVTGSLFRGFRCPRCGRKYLRPFDVRSFVDYWISSSNCANCGLKKYAGHP